MGVGPHDGYLLRLFGAHVDQAFGHVPFQVGSSLTEKRDWRDVDVRLLLPDEEYAEYFGDPQGETHDAVRLRLWNLAWTTLGQKMTGLPIDFQIQPLYAANAEFDGPRSALVLRASELPVVQDGRR
jgi:hypothetical protein